MRLADLALYRSKQAGRNRFAFFEAKMGEDCGCARAPRTNCAPAIENDELQLLYQPILSAQDGK